MSLRFQVSGFIRRVAWESTLSDHSQVVKHLKINYTHCITTSYIEIKISPENIDAVALVVKVQRPSSNDHQS